MDSAGQVKLAVIILTQNEEANLPACLESLRGLDCDPLVVDSGSTDGTLEVVRAHKAQLATHPFESHAKQWKWAIGNLPSDQEWVLGLDADQRLTDELRDELRELFSVHAYALHGVDGFYVKRRQIFRGQWIRHGGYYPKYLLKLFRRSKVQIDELDLMDHHFYVVGPTAKLRFDLFEDNRKEGSIEFWIDKHNRYAALHAREELMRRRDSASWKIKARLFGSPDERVLWLKRRWYRLPLYVRPFLYFMWRYLVQLGFLDGKQGFLFHFLQAFWYRVLVDAHLDDLLGERGGDLRHLDRARKAI
jgi:glycosyltransferase involved in cell wall biosynthesis